MPCGRGAAGDRDGRRREAGDRDGRRREAGDQMRRCAEGGAIEDEEEGLEGLDVQGGEKGLEADQDERQEEESEENTDIGEREPPVVSKPYQVIVLSCTQEQCLIQVRWRVRAEGCSQNVERDVEKGLEESSKPEQRVYAFSGSIQQSLGRRVDFNSIQGEEKRTISCGCVDLLGQDKVLEIIRATKSQHNLGDTDKPSDDVLKILKSFKNKVDVRYFAKFEAHLTRTLHESALQKGIVEIEIMVCPSGNHRLSEQYLNADQASQHSKQDQPKLSSNFLNPVIAGLSLAEDEVSNSSVYSLTTSHMDEIRLDPQANRGFSVKQQNSLISTRQNGFPRKSSPSARVVSSQTQPQFSVGLEIPEMNSPLSTVTPLVSAQPHIQHRTTDFQFIQVWSKSPRVLSEFKPAILSCTSLQHNLRASHILKTELARVQILSYPSSKVLLRQSIVRQRINAGAHVEDHRIGQGNSDDENDGDDDEGFANIPRFHVEEDETAPRYYTMTLPAPHHTKIVSGYTKHTSGSVHIQEPRTSNSKMTCELMKQETSSDSPEPQKTTVKRRVSVSAYTCIEDCSFLNDTGNNFSVLRVCDIVRRRVVSVQVPDTIVEDFVICGSEVFVCGRTTAEKLWLKAKEAFRGTGVQQSIMPYFLWVVEKYRVMIDEQDGLVFEQVLKIMEPSFSAKQEHSYLHKITVRDSNLVCLRVNGLHQTAILKSFDMQDLKQQSDLAGYVDQRISGNLQTSYEITEVDLQRGLLRMKSLHVTREVPGERNLPASIQLKHHSV